MSASVVPESARPLQKMFQAVPPSYDLLNRLLTFRMDQYWRSRAARIILGGEPKQILDLCTGTGDLALMLGKRAGPETEIKGLDYSRPMLSIASKKAGRKQLNSIVFIQGDAAAMPFPDASFDVVGIAFAFRNLTYHHPDRDRFLGEIIRVLKPGGRFIAVETSQPGNKLIRKCFHLYMKLFTARLGAWLSGHKGAYHYLAHSAINFYPPSEVQSFLLQAGFSRVIYRPQARGVAGIWECTL